MTASDHLNPQQFYHGTNADLQPGDEIEPRVPDAAQWEKPHTYVTSNPVRARGFADRKVAGYGGEARIYAVQPSGDVEPDPGTMGGDSYRSKRSLRVLGPVELPSREKYRYSEDWRS